MHAVRYERYGPPEVLEIQQVEEPHPAPGEVLVTVRAAGLNPVDSKFRMGSGSGLPAGAGREFAGVVTQLGCRRHRIHCRR